MKRLSGEIVELKQHLEHYDKVQELTQMLQESHRCPCRGGEGRGLGGRAQEQQLPVPGVPGPRVLLRCRGTSMSVPFLTTRDSLSVAVFCEA